MRQENVMYNEVCVGVKADKYRRERERIALRVLFAYEGGISLCPGGKRREKKIENGEGIKPDRGRG